MNFNNDKRLLDSRCLLVIYTSLGSKFFNLSPFLLLEVLILVILVLEQQPSLHVPSEGEHKIIELKSHSNFFMRFT